METVARPTAARTTRPDAGYCVCGVPVPDHVDGHNRHLTCDAARRRWATRLDIERQHSELLMNIIATVWCVRLGRTIVTTPPLGSLLEHQQQDARLFAQMVLTMLDPDRVRIARQRAIDRGLEELRQATGQRELDLKIARQSTVILKGVLTKFLHSLQGLDPISDVDVARAIDRVVTPPSRVESAAEAEGAFLTGRDHPGDETLAREGEVRS